MKKRSDSEAENLFESATHRAAGRTPASDSDRATEEPLAARMRPRSLDEFIGQDHIMAPGRLLRRAIQADMLSSVIFAGPPGTGKTTLARVIANHTRSQFISLNAVLSGVKDVREAIQRANEHRNLYGRRTILFVDEVHRWNKAQQDALLPWVENGTVILIGATTENPFFEVNAALVSRSRIFQLKPLTRKDLVDVAGAALSDRERGYGSMSVDFEPGALEHLIEVADGDARTLLNALQLAVETSPDQFPPTPGATITISLEAAEDSIQRKVVLYDKEGDYHFDTISAFIKSLRGSDPDAALYWMARMVAAGEDPHYVFRRMLVLASEDVGLADPMALVVVTAAADAFDRVGMPEGQYHLSHAALYLATCPKSNSTLAFFDALKSVEEEPSVEVPNPLRDANRDRKGFGHGEGYQYPHSYRDHWVAQAYLPRSLQGRTFYRPGDQGYERKIRPDIERRREIQIAAMFEGPANAPEEVLTFSPESSARRRWMRRVRNNDEGLVLDSENAKDKAGGIADAGAVRTLTAAELLSEVRRRLFTNIDLKRHHRVLVYDPGHGTLVWEAVRGVPEGLVVGIVQDPESLSIVAHFSDDLPELERPTLYSAADGTPDLPEALQFERIVLRDPVTRRFPAPVEGVFRATEDRAWKHLADRAAEASRIAIAQVIPRAGTRPSELCPWTASDQELQERVRDAEAALYEASENPLVNWTHATLSETLTRAFGTAPEQSDLCHYTQNRFVGTDEIDRWTGTKPGNTYAQVLAAALTEEELRRYKNLLLESVADREVHWRTEIVYLLFSR